MPILTVITSLLATVFLAAAAPAATFDLDNWWAEGPGSWHASGNEVSQSLNSGPTVFHSGTSALGRRLSGTIAVETTSDNDAIGLVVGYGAGDLANAAADYLMIDWRQSTQSAYGCSGAGGLAISRVRGALPAGAGAWCHTGNVEELARGATLGATGWADLTSYDFDLLYTRTRLEFRVDGSLEFALDGAFGDGAFGFYNNSQASVRYAGVSEDVAVRSASSSAMPSTPPVLVPVSVPATLPMLMAGLLAAGFVAHVRQTTSL